MKNPSPKLLYDMLRIRRLQERIDREYLKDNMHTPVHLCTGQEAIAVGVCSVLFPDDVISSNHRGHGHYLAKGGNMRKLVAELHGRSTGCSKGFGGSMHLVAPEVGHLGSSSIVGGGIPIGTGHALAFAMRGEARVSVVFFGDGASEEGVFYESINFAVLKRLPVVYILENNGWAVCSPLAHRERLPNVFLKGLPGEDLFALSIDGNDIEAVRDAASKAVHRARQGQGPSLIECKTWRMAGHAGCAAQEPKGYRDEEELAQGKAACPIARFRGVLEKRGEICTEQWNCWEKELALELDEAFAFALASPFPQPSDTSGVVFCE